MTGDRPPRLLFRFDASATVGWGHMARCLALDEALDGRMESVFAVNDEALTGLPPAARKTALSPGAIAGSGPFTAAVVDHYGMRAKDETRLRVTARKIVVLDDLADRYHDADMLVDALPGGGPERYRKLVPSACRILTGADFAPLHPRFRTACLADRKTRIEGAPLKVLVSMGATDPGDVSRRVLKEIDASDLSLSVTVVLGSAAPHRDGIRALCRKMRQPAELLVGVEDMASLYGQHDIAVGAPGVSALERACVGLPTLLVMTADNQLHVGRALAEAGAAVTLGQADVLAPGAITAALSELAGNTDARDAMTRQGCALVDGLGAARIAAHILTEPKTKDGAALVARRLKAGDEGAILHWQATPGARRFSRNPEPPTEAQHAAWMASRLTSREAVTEVLTLDGEPIAMVRSDNRDDETEVSVIVAPEQMGRRIGTAAIRYLQALLPRTPLTAYIHPENEGSLRLFSACGFGSSGPYRMRMLDA